MPSPGHKDDVGAAVHDFLSDPANERLTPDIAARMPVRLTSAASKFCNDPLAYVRVWVDRTCKFGAGRVPLPIGRSAGASSAILL
jgi:hypothetical protein